MLGLDGASEAVYRAMLSDPEGSVQDLCEQLGVPESTVRDALDRLADLRLLRASREALGVMRPVSRSSAWRCSCDDRRRNSCADGRSSN